MPSMLTGQQGIVQPRQLGGLSDARPTTMQAVQQNPKVGPAQLAAPQPPVQQNAAPLPAPSTQMIAQAPQQMAMNPALLQQILSTMLLQPQQSLGAMMQPQQAGPVAPTTTAASTLTGGPTNG